MTENDIKIVRKLKNLIQTKINVLEVKVFGSRARGDNNEFSDLDVLIVVEHLNNDIERFVSNCAWEVGFDEDVIILPITISVDTLKNSPLRESIFIKNVNREGVCI